MSIGLSPNVHDGDTSNDPLGIFDSSDGSVLFLQVSVFAFTVVTPLLYSVTLLVLQLTKNPRVNTFALLLQQVQSSLLFQYLLFNYVLFSSDPSLLTSSLLLYTYQWVCVDVYLLGFAVTMTELSHMASFFSGRISSLCLYLGDLIVGVTEDDVCFSVEATRLSGLTYLILATLLLIVLQSFVLCDAKRVIAAAKAKARYGRRRDASHASNKNNSAELTGNHFSHTTTHRSHTTTHHHVSNSGMMVEMEDCAAVGVEMIEVTPGDIELYGRSLLPMTSAKPVTPFVDFPKVNDV